MTETAPPETGAPRPPSRKRAGRQLVEWVLVLALALLAAFLIKTFLVQPFSIPSGSMEPTIKPGDRVLVNKLSYDFHPVHRGDIVVFKKPLSDTEGGSIQDLIKRVIGLPGETLRSGPHGEVFVDGRLIRQPWLTRAARIDPGPAICAPGNSYSHVDCRGSVLHLPRGEYFVMGDNRGDSEDSRYWGPLPDHLIVGRAFVIFWPLSRLHWF